MVRKAVSIFRNNGYLWVVLVIALMLRLYRLTSLSLWLDEGSSIRFSKLAVSQLLGSAGIYDTHPPLYYLIVHYVLKLVPDVAAGRLVSATVGTLSVLVIYVLGREIYSLRAGIVAAMLIAVSPLHIWYSQEARMYALLGLLGLVSYLSLWLASNRQQWWLWPVYVLSTTLTLYTDYSAALVLVPQLVLLPLLSRRRQVLRKFALALVIVCFLYLPWLHLMLETLGMVAEHGVLPDMDPVTPRHLFLTMLDFAALGSTYFFGTELPWVRWPPLMAVILLVQFLGIGKGLLALRPKPERALLIGGLMIIPPVLLFLLSLRTPMYWTRTVLGASFGLSLLLGVGIVSLGRRTASKVAVASVILASALVPSLLTSQIMYHGAAKQKWNDLAADLRIGFRSGAVVLYYPAVARTLVNAYFTPTQAGGIEQTIGEGSAYEQIDRLLSTTVSDINFVWLAYQQYPGLELIREWLSRQGYATLFKQTYWYPLGLELYSRERVLSGTNILHNGNFQLLNSGKPVLWEFNAPYAVDGDSLVQINTVENPSNDAVQTVVLKPRTFYFLTFEHRNSLSSGSQRVYVLVFDSKDKLLEIVPNGAGMYLPTTETWANATLGLITPGNTAKGTVILRNSGIGKTWFRNISLVQQ